MGKGPYLRDPVVFAIHKPVGPTSTQVVSSLKKLLSRSDIKGEAPFKKIGHFGTLDPFAEGLLLIGANGATKLSNSLHRELPKTYEAEGILGKRTDSGDRMGEEELTDPAPQKYQRMSAQELNSLFQKEFVGEYWQRPQKFSAAKHQGKALYQWAREGVEVEKPPVKRFIHEFTIVEYDYPRVRFRVTVSTGTYIRVLFTDMAQKLETGGHLLKLHRSFIGDLSDEQALQFDTVEDRLSPDFLTKEDLQRASLPLDRVLKYPKRLCSESEAYAFCHGRTLDPKEDASSDTSYVWIMAENAGPSEELLLGLARRGPQGDVPEVVFPGPQNRLLKIY